LLVRLVVVVVVGGGGRDCCCCGGGAGGRERCGCDEVRRLGRVEGQEGGCRGACGRVAVLELMLVVLVGEESEVVVHLCFQQSRLFVIRRQLSIQYHHKPLIRKINERELTFKKN
jgi:hypothetical protein